MPYTIENLGVAGYGSANLDWDLGAMARRPDTGAEVALHAMFEFGFIVIDPRTRESVHVRPEDPLVTLTGRGAAQAADGLVYQMGCRVDAAQKSKTWSVFAWDWKTPGLRAVAECPKGYTWYRTPESAPDGTLYVGGADGVPVFRFDPRTGQFAKHADGVPAVTVDRAGCVYTSVDGQIVQLDGATGERRRVSLPDGRPCPIGEIKKDGAGRVIVVTTVGVADGRSQWVQLLNGKATPIDAGDARLVQTIIGNNELSISDPGQRFITPFVFADGGYISRIIGKEVTYVDPHNVATSFVMDRKDGPLRLYSLERCGDDIWLGGVLPLYLLSYNTTSSKFSNFGNPTLCVGEIYNFVESRGRIYFAGYPKSYIARYDPNRPWRLDLTDQANPRQLGRMKNEGLPVHRIHGCAKDTAGNVYFTAFGDYGCIDSAFVRIDIETEEMTRSIYPATNMGAICHLPASDRILVCENSQTERAIHFTFLAPKTGEVLESKRMIADGGMVTSWLHDGGDLVYGLHDYRATLFAYSLSEGRIVRSMPELGFGHHLKNCLVFGPDGRIWSLTNNCVFAVDRELKTKERLADFEDLTRSYAGEHSRFGACFGADGHFYFINGPCLMRMLTTGLAPSPSGSGQR